MGTKKKNIKLLKNLKRVENIEDFITELSREKIKRGSHHNLFFDNSIRVHGKSGDSINRHDTPSLLIEHKAKQEKQVKYDIVHLFGASKFNIRAYLLDFKCKEVSVLTLCLMLENMEEKSVIEKYISTSRLLEGVQLDILYLDKEQESILKSHCPPFYTSPKFHIQKPDFRLFSSEGYGLDDTYRDCFVRKQLYGPLPGGFVLCDINPPLRMESFGRVKEIDQLLVSGRHEGYPLYPLSESPCYVFVLRPLRDLQEKIEITNADFELVAWAEVYYEDTKQDDALNSTCTI